MEKQNISPKPTLQLHPTKFKGFGIGDGGKGKIHGIPQSHYLQTPSQNTNFKNSSATGIQRFQYFHSSDEERNLQITGFLLTLYAMTHSEVSI